MLMPGDADGEVLLPRSGPDPGPGSSSGVRALPDPAELSVPALCVAKALG